MEDLLSNPKVTAFLGGAAVTAGAFFWDWIKRKLPGAKPLFQAIDDRLDKTPGWKNRDK